MIVVPLLIIASRHCFAWDISASLPAESVMRTGDPGCRKADAIWNLIRLLLARLPARCRCFFDTIRSNPMGFDVGGVYHKGLKIRVLLRQSIEYLLENPSL